MGVDKLKRETTGLLIVIVSMILVLSGMFWFASAPANGDDWTHLEPIFEDANLTMTINHTGKATVIPVWFCRSPPYDMMTVRNNSDLLDNFDRIYLIAYHFEFPKMEKDHDAKTIKSSSTREVRFYFVASEGEITVYSWAGKARMENTPDSSGYFRWDVETNDDQTTYTFHYPKIIGWE